MLFINSGKEKATILLQAGRSVLQLEKSVVITDIPSISPFKGISNLSRNDPALMTLKAYTMGTRGKLIYHARNAAETKNFVKTKA